MDKRKLLSVMSFSFFAFNVTAQGSVRELLGSDLTVEESLVQFVNAVTTFDVQGAPGVLLYVVTPLIGFYFLTLNFVSMGYELFEERIDRPSWNHADDDIPTGMKGFSMIVSVITVLFLGTAGASLLLFAGLGSLALAVLMMTGLLNEGLGDGGGQQQQQQNQQTQQTQQPPQQEQQGGSNWGDMFSAAANLFGTAQNTAQGLQQQQQQQAANQLQESLRYFQDDIVSEMDRVRNNRTDIENMIGQANNEISDPNDLRPEAFKNMIQRASALESLLDEVRNKMVQDFNAAPDPDYTGSNLAQFIYAKNISGSGDRNPLKEIEALEGQLERILSSGAVNPPDDIFNDLLEELRYVVALGHFIHKCPFDMSEISVDDSKAQKVVTEAQNMNKISSRPDNVSKVKSLAGWADARQSVASNLITEAESLCKKELKVNQSEINALKSLIGEDEKIHNKLKWIARNISKYKNIRSFESDIQTAEAEMKTIDNKLASLESKLSSSSEYESDIYEKLKELEGKI